MTAAVDPIHIRQAILDDAVAVTAITGAAYSKYIARIGRQPRPMTDDYSQIIANHAVWLLCKLEWPVGVLVLMAEPEAIM